MKRVLPVVMAFVVFAPVTWARAEPRGVDAPTTRSVRWLALGDSFSSGEGIPGANGGNPDLQGKETCQRANGDNTNAKAYSVVAVETLQSSPVEGLEFERPFFVACTGAIADDVDQQISEMRSVVPVELQKWDIVSLSFGGNNILFADVLTDCLDLFDAWGSLTLEGCSTNEERLRQRVDMLVGKRSIVEGEYQGVVTLPTLYDRVAGVVAPGGHVIVAGYPNLLEEPGRWASWIDRSGIGCQGVLREDIGMLRSVTGYLNEQIALAVQAANLLWKDRGVEFHFADLATEVYETSDSPDDRHGLCTNEQWINGVTLGFTSGDVRTDRSFHPTQNGHNATGQRIADIVRRLTFRQPDILRAGSVGDRVVAAQTALNAAGYVSGEPDGEFGEVTAAAVREFQADSGRNPTGELDEAGFDELLALAARAPNCESSSLQGSAQLQPYWVWADDPICQPGWAVHSAYLPDSAASEWFLFRVRGDRWQLEKRSVGRELTIGLSDGTALPRARFARLFGQPGWPTRVSSADEVARFIMVGALENAGTLPGAWELVSMYLDGAGFDVWVDWLYNEPSEGSLEACVLTDANPYVDHQHWECRWAIDALDYLIIAVDPSLDRATAYRYFVAE